MNAALSLRSFLRYLRMSGKKLFARSVNAHLKVLGYVALTAVAVTGLLWTSATPAHACSCALPMTEETAREVLESSDAIVTGSVVEHSPDRVEMAVDTVYKGPRDSTITVRQPAGFDQKYANPGDAFAALETIGADCSYAIIGPPEQRYFLVLSEAGDGTYQAAGCTSVSFRTMGKDDYYKQSLEVFKQVAGPGVAPEGDDAGSGSGDAGGGFPYIPVAAGAGLGLLALLAGAAFAGRRRA